jgi:hypothetical protein
VRLPWGLLGMIALVAIVEGFVSAHRLDFTPTDTSIWALKGLAARGEAAESRVLCFGDSLAIHGLLPPVIEARTGGPAYNLGVCAGQASTSYYLLRRTLDAGARPSAILVDFAPDILSGRPVDVARNWPEMATVRETLDFSWKARDARFFSAAGLSLLLPSYRSRFEVRANVRAALAGAEGSPGSITRRQWRNWGVNRGAQVTPKNPAFAGEVTPEQHEQLLTDKFWCNRVNERYVRAFLGLAASEGVSVFWVLPPESPEVIARREASGSAAKLSRFVREMQGRFPGVTVLNARGSGYPHSVFVDPRHLDHEGGTTLSSDVAEIVARRLAGEPLPSWVDLPRFRPVPSPVPLEDVHQSALVLRIKP